MLCKIRYGQYWFDESKISLDEFSRIVEYNPYLGYGRYLHRVDGPAVIINEHHWTWYLNGRVHRINGPALGFYGKEDYYLWDCRLLKEDYDAFMDFCKENDEISLKLKIIGDLE